MSRPSLLAVLLVALAMSCSQSSSPPPPPPRDAGTDASCPAGFLGDPSAQPAFTFLVLHADGSVVALRDGDQVPMIFPPQGGRVIFVGVRATNVDGCALEITGALRDETTSEVRIDLRTVNLIATGDGWGVSAPIGNEPIAAAISSFANIPVCPNQWSATDIYGHEYSLEVTIKDRGGRMLTNKIHVTPECGEPQNLEECLCICQTGYVLGQSCGDGGAGEAATSDAGGPG